MKLDYRFSEIAKLFNQEVSSDGHVHSVAFDTRRIFNGENQLFFALNSKARDGHDFITDAYKKGIRHFVVSDSSAVRHLQGASTIVVNNTWDALCELAKFHRERFDIPVIAITGSYGKTTCKEWLAEILRTKFKVVRSPKSYNSRLGVALSLLEINSETEIAIIEAGITKPGDMHHLYEMIQPTHGIFTGLGQAHRANFESENQHLNEKLSLFKNLDSFLHYSNIDSGERVKLSDNASVKSFNSQQIQLLSCVQTMAETFIDSESVGKISSSLKTPSLRMEIKEGKDGNLIINDSYHLDADSLKFALEYQLHRSEGKNRVVILGQVDSEEKKDIGQVLSEFKPEQIIQYSPSVELPAIENSVILIKGKRKDRMELLASELELHKHTTFIEIDFPAIRHNINAHLDQVPAGTELLCMVKAYSYGSDATKMGRFLSDLGVHYLGVAYPNEGVELRNAGIETPILVMNSDPANYSTCIEHNLEPAIFDLNHLERFIEACILRRVSEFPIHLKLETGMNRLGFDTDNLDSILGTLQAQPEVRVESIYSHLAESDIQNSSHVLEQIERFESLSNQIQSGLNYPLKRHILNSAGIHNYSNAHFDRVRLGIGMYGLSSNKEWESQLKPAISWYSRVSQVKTINPDESVGYNRHFVAEKTTKIAVIPVGYADGFRRLLGNGQAGVYIQNTFCPTVGSVCMDMIMVDLGELEIEVGELVEIIGKNQSITTLARQCQTIPYEILTGLSERMERVYIES